MSLGTSDAQLRNFPQSADEPYAQVQELSFGRKGKAWERLGWRGWGGKRREDVREHGEDGKKRGIFRDY